MADVPEADRAFIGEDDLATITAIAKQSGWSQEDAQNRLTEDIALRKFAHTRLLEEAKADPYIGGDKLATTQQLAKSGLDALLPASNPTLAAYRTRLERDMARLGLSNYPPLAVLLSEAGKRITEDSPSAGASATAGATQTGPLTPDAAAASLWPKKT